MADLKLFDMKVHFSENTMATVLSLSDVASLDGVHLTMNTLEERTILLHLGDGKVIKFKECDDGLYYFDTAAPLAHSVGVTSNNGVIGYFFTNRSRNFRVLFKTRNQRSKRSTTSTTYFTVA
eukprot:3749865-Ditylum_brightwellii.AAC.1